LRPSECLDLWTSLLSTLDSSSAKESEGEEIDASNAELLGVFNQAPSLSTRLLISTEERFRGACSMMEFMLPALSERRDIRAGGEPMLITEEILLLTE
jgi:hypothetical protein